MRQRAPALVAATVALALAPGAATSAAAPIPSDPKPADVEPFQGTAAKPRRLAAKEPPRHPHMAPNGRSSLHNDGYQSDTNWTAGPLGRDMSVVSTAQFADCASVTFDSRGRVVTVCVGLDGPRLMLMDPRTLDTIAMRPLPPRIPSGGGSISTTSSGAATSTSTTTTAPSSPRPPGTCS